MFCAVADKIKVETGLRLMGDRSEHIEIDHKVVITALEQWIVHDPGGQRQVTNQPFTHRGVIVVTEDGQQGIAIIAITIPHGIPARTLWFIGFVSLFAGFQIVVAFAAVFQPFRTEGQQVVILAGQAEQVADLGTVIFIGDVEILIRLLKHGPEMVADHIGGHLTAANRATNKGAHKILGFIQHKLIAGAGRNVGKSDEGIGALFITITGQLFYFPVGAEKLFSGPRQFVLGQAQGDMGFVHQRAADRGYAVPEILWRHLIGAIGGNPFDRLPRGRAGAVKLEEVGRFAVFSLVQIQVSQEQVLV